MPSLVAGRLFDIGYFRLPIAVFSVIMVLATFLIAECTKYWHFLLCQGLAVGLSCGIIFGPTISIVSHWFKRKRSTALGIVACGSSLGGTIFPIAFNNLVQEVGFKWTMRIIGFMLLALLAIPNIVSERYSQLSIERALII
jgi:MCP family monocarboxylic acid transporter-like MFS transporter 10